MRLTTRGHEIFQKVRSLDNFRGLATSLRFRISRRFVEFLGLNRKYVDNHKISSLSEANTILRNSIGSGEPILISRFGTTEMEFCLEWNKTSLEKANSSHKVRNLWVLSGVFPLNDLQLTEFFEAYTSSAHEIDICGIRIRSLEYSNWALETNMLQEFPINSSFIDIELLCPIEIDNPWTSALRNKRILIIHPFSKSIEKQLLLRKRLFPNSDWLPEAEYSVLQAPQTLSASNSAETWTTNLAKLKQDVSKMEFDIALIGCGAYGLPLGAFIKERGKIAIHVGGALQLYFGIRGLRWDKELKQTIPPECLQYWCWPDKSEIPIESRKVEGGAYWGGQQST